ncbi:hypothetical protein HPB51_022107 [Rhipicephalus microplus]|uniref:VWFA domain-containing protein n=1 Tax=Rhipicephalus microplus TaxID=6941 RepID=A0A9J6ECT9_RHIMP|nr:hypothetical protein HPB51_022107 [Rhipicephalus microplus]
MYKEHTNLALGYFWVLISKGVPIRFCKGPWAYLDPHSLGEIVENPPLLSKYWISRHKRTSGLALGRNDGPNPDLSWTRTANPRMVRLQAHPHDGRCPREKQPDYPRQQIRRSPAPAGSRPQLHCCVPLICVNTLEIDKTDGGYKDLLISINQDVPYNETIVENIKASYVFVHEWAHFRYGVFDEYGRRDDDKYPLTYCDGKEVKLNACSKRLRYIPKLPSGKWCKLNKATCTFSKDCPIRFTTSAKDPVESSIMFMPYVANVSQFCDSSNGVRAHNPNAPNKQNAVCKKRSTWEVISENEDFKGLSKPDLSKNIEVSFEETQQREDLPQRVVLVLDVSISMDRMNRLTFLKEAATRYIQDIADGSKRLAIVTFSTTATVHHTLMPVNVNTRRGFVDAVEKLQTNGHYMHWLRPPTSTRGE